MAFGEHYRLALIHERPYSLIYDDANATEDETVSNCLLHG